MIVKDYRPVSHPFHLGKVCEAANIGKMRSKLEEIIEPSQFAYQPNIGTVDALIKLLDDYTSELDNPNSKFIQSAALDFLWPLTGYSRQIGRASCRESV